MGYAQDAMVELHGNRITDNTPPTTQEAYENAAKLPDLLREIYRELQSARATHAPMSSHHEGYAVILEELDELWEVCKQNTHPRNSQIHQGMTVEMLRMQKRAAMRKEAIQVAAMAIRFIEDVCDTA